MYFSEFRHVRSAEFRVLNTLKKTQTYAIRLVSLFASCNVEDFTDVVQVLGDRGTLGW